MSHWDYIGMVVAFTVIGTASLIASVLFGAALAEAGPNNRAGAAWMVAVFFFLGIASLVGANLLLLFGK